MNSQGWYLTPVTDVKSYSDALKPLVAEQQHACANFQVVVPKKMACKPAETTQQQFSDRSKISSDERAAFLKYRAVLVEVNQKIAELNRQYNSKNGEAIASAIEINSAQGDRNATELLESRIAWGEFNRRRAENYKKYEDDLKLALR
jgi:hypothetical protein